MKRTKVLLLAGLFMMILSGSLYAQDPYFSQYFMSPMSNNPAMIGKGISDMRVLMNHKNQWWGSSAAAFNITSLSFEKKVKASNEALDEFGVGVMLESEASNGGLLKNTHFSVGSAYNKKMDEYSTIGIGILFNYANRFIDVNKFQTQSQYGSFGFNQFLPSNDLIQIPNSSYFDANAGIRYSIAKPNWGFNMGASILHNAKAKVSAYFNSNYSLATRVNLQSSFYKKYRETDEFGFGFNYDIQGVNRVFSLGGMYKFQLPGVHLVQKLNLGVWNRFNDAIVPYVGVESKDWCMGFTYDIVTSDLKTYYNSVQSMELSFGWQFTGTKKRKKPLTHVRMFEY